ncbi:helix-turn-helix domain-containing protein [Naumannella sp. ID2617S]|nr:helix-turn-helix domain-containing protein [Naumannella sp. ID2617S]
MTEYNAIATYDLPYRGHLANEFTVDTHERLERYHPATGASADGHGQVTITLHAEDLGQAMDLAARLLASAGSPPALELEVLTTERFDARAGLIPVPELVSISEAATQLGISRQAVLQRIEAGRIPARKVGSAWVIASANLPVTEP